MSRIWLLRSEVARARVRQRLFLPLAAIRFDRVLGHDQFHMRQCIWNVTEKGACFVRANEFQRPLVNLVMGVARSLMSRVFGQEKFCVIMPQIIRVIKMRMDLVIKSEPCIESLLQWEP